MLNEINKNLARKNLQKTLSLFVNILNINIYLSGIKNDKSA